MCAKCLEAEMKKTEPEEHKCPRNYTGSSKAMKADAALEAYEEIYRISGGSTVIGHIIADDDSSMRSLLRHATMNHRKGALPLELPEPEWLADPTHRTKVMAKPFFALASLGKSESMCTKVDATRIKQWWGYMIKYYRSYPLEVVRKAAKSVLEHLFDNHEYCDVKWCKPLREQLKQKQNEDAPSIAGGVAARPPSQATPHYPATPNPTSITQLHGTSHSNTTTANVPAADAAGPGRHDSLPPMNPARTSSSNTNRQSTCCERERKGLLQV